MLSLLSVRETPERKIFVRGIAEGRKFPRCLFVVKASFTLNSGNRQVAYTHTPRLKFQLNIHPPFETSAVTVWLNC